MDGKGIACRFGIGFGMVSYGIAKTVVLGYPSWFLVIRLVVVGACAGYAASCVR